MNMNKRARKRKKKIFKKRMKEWYKKREKSIQFSKGSFFVGFFCATHWKFYRHWNWQFDTHSAPLQGACRRPTNPRLRSVSDLMSSRAALWPGFLWFGLNTHKELGSIRVWGELISGGTNPEDIFLQELKKNLKKKSQRITPTITRRREAFHCHPPSGEDCKNPTTGVRGLSSSPPPSVGKDSKNPTKKNRFRGDGKKYRAVQIRGHFFWQGV